MAVGPTIERLRVLARQSLDDLFDQSKPFGRLALVQVLMLAGDTLVTISLAGSLFFSISPHEAKSKVFLYLVLTLAPFTVVSPLLGPLIDRSRGARRAMVVFAGIGRAAICPFMAMDVHSLLLFPEAFAILVLSKLYLVTRGALVPEMMATGPLGGVVGYPAGNDAASNGEPNSSNSQVSQISPPGPIGPIGPLGSAANDARDTGAPSGDSEFAALNARLTLLGTLAGFVISVPGVLLLKLAGAPAVLVLATLVFLAAGVAGARLPVIVARRAGRSGDGRSAPGDGRAVPQARRPERGDGRAAWEAADSRDAWAPASDPDLARLQPVAHPEVLFGLTTMSLIRGVAGFLIFLLAFGLRRLHAGLGWYGFALGASGIGSLVGLALVPRLRRRLGEPQILTASVWLIAVAAVGAAFWGKLPAQAALAFVIGVAGACAQPSFDAMTQRYVPVAAQGRTFARFATRQQLVWVLGALIPVVIALPLAAGDVVIAAVSGIGGLFYITSRRALHHRAMPRGSHAAPSEPHPRRPAEPR